MVSLNDILAGNAYSFNHRSRDDDDDPLRRILENPPQFSGSTPPASHPAMRGGSGGRGSGFRFEGSTPPSGHPAMRDQSSGFNFRGSTPPQEHPARGGGPEGRFSEQLRGLMDQQNFRNRAMNTQVHPTQRPQQEDSGFSFGDLPGSGFANTLRNQAETVVDNRGEFADAGKSIGNFLKPDDPVANFVKDRGRDLWDYLDYEDPRESDDPLVRETSKFLEDEAGKIRDTEFETTPVTDSARATFDPKFRTQRDDQKTIGQLDGLLGTGIRPQSLVEPGALLEDVGVQTESDILKEASNPLNLAFALGGGPAAQALRGSRFTRPLAQFVEPFAGSTSSMRNRILSEQAAAQGFTLGEQTTDNPILSMAAGMATGSLAGSGIASMGARNATQNAQVLNAIGGEGGNWAQRAREAIDGGPKNAIGRNWVRKLKNAGMTDQEIEQTGLGRVLSDPTKKVPRTTVQETFENFLQTADLTQSVKRTPAVSRDVESGRDFAREDIFVRDIPEYNLEQESINLEDQVQERFEEATRPLEAQRDVRKFESEPMDLSSPGEEVPPVRSFFIQPGNRVETTKFREWQELQPISMMEEPREANIQKFRQDFEKEFLRNKVRRGTDDYQTHLRLKQVEEETGGLSEYIRNIEVPKRNKVQVEDAYELVRSRLALGQNQTLPNDLLPETPRIDTTRGDRPIKGKPYATVRERLKELASKQVDDETQGILGEMEELRNTDFDSFVSQDEFIPTNLTGDPQIRAQEMLKTLDNENLEKVVSFDDWDEAFRNLQLISDYRNVGLLRQPIRGTQTVFTGDEITDEFTSDDDWAAPVGMFGLAAGEDGSMIVRHVPEDFQLEALNIARNGDRSPGFSNGVRIAEEESSSGLKFTEVLDEDEFGEPAANMPGFRPAQSKLPIRQRRIDANMSASGKAATGVVDVGSGVNVFRPRSLQEAIDNLGTMRTKAARWLVRGNGAIPAIDRSKGARSDVEESIFGYRQNQYINNHLVEQSKHSLRHFAADLLGKGEKSKRIFTRSNPIKRLMNTDDDGVFRSGKEKGKHWLDVYEDIENWVGELDPRKVQFIRQYHKYFDSLNNMLIENGIEPLERNQNGKFIIPRSVEEIHGFDVRNQVDHFKDRLYDTTTEAIANGIKYGDPENTFTSHAIATYTAINDKQLADYVKQEGISYTSEHLMDQKIVQRYRFMEEQMEELLTDWNDINRQLDEEPDNADLLSIRDNIIQKYRTRKKEKTRVGKDYKAEKRRVKAKEDKIFMDEGGEKVQLKQWQNKFMGEERFFRAEDFDMLVDEFGMGAVKPRKRDKSVFWSIAETPPSLSRLLAAGLDMGTQSIQMLPWLTRRPHHLGPLMYKMTQTFIDPEYISKEYSNNAQQYADMVRAGVTFDDESYQLIQDARLGKPIGNRIKKAPVVGKGLEQVYQQSLGRFQARHNGGLNIQRRMMWDSLKKQRLEDEKGIASLINNLTGGFNTKAAMIGEGQRAMESWGLAFSPRFLRSTVASLGMAAKGAGSAATLGKYGSPADRQALYTMGTMAMAGAGIFTLLGMTLGKSQEEIEETLNPLSGKQFLSYQMGPRNEHIGIGGQFRAITQFMTESIHTAATGNTEAFTKMDWYDNPLISFWTSRGAMGIRQAGAFMEGFLDIDAVPYEEIDSPKDALFYNMKSAIPFWGAGYFEDNALLGVPAEFGGLRSSPETFSEKRERRSMDEFGVPYEELNNEETRQFNKRHPTSRSPEDDNLTRFFNNRSDIEKRFQRDVAYLESLTLAGDINREEFRERYNERRDQKFTEINQLEETFENMPANRYDFSGSVMEYLNEDEENVQPEDAAVQKWYAATDKAIGEDGELDFDKLDTIREGILNDLDDETKEYVLRNTESSERFSQYGIVDEYENVKDTTEIYFEANNDIFQRLKPSSQLLNQFEDYDEYTEFISEKAAEYGVSEQDLTYLLGNVSPEIEAFNEVSSMYQRFLRLSDPKLDEALVDWYGYQPANRVAHVLGQYGQEEAQQAAADIRGPKLLTGEETNTRQSGLETAALARAHGLQPENLNTQKLGEMVKTIEKYNWTPLRSQPPMLQSS